MLRLSIPMSSEKKLLQLIQKIWQLPEGGLDKQLNGGFRCTRAMTSQAYYSTPMLAGNEKGHNLVKLDGRCRT